MSKKYTMPITFKPQMLLENGLRTNESKDLFMWSISDEFGEWFERIGNKELLVEELEATIKRISVINKYRNALLQMKGEEKAYKEMSLKLHYLTLKVEALSKLIRSE